MHIEKTLQNITGKSVIRSQKNHYNTSHNKLLCPFVHTQD